MGVLVAGEDDSRGWELVEPGPLMLERR